MSKVAAVATALAMFAGATPAFAAVNSSSITITTTNRGTIDNNTSAKSHTGDNTAEGSVGGRGGVGGDVTSDGNNNNGGAMTGEGGNGGNGGAGGLVDTGNASADAKTDNALNTTEVDMDLVSAAVAGFNSTALLVNTDNGQCGECNKITNDTRARARSGENTAEGSVGGNADNAGDVEGGTGNFNNGGATTGDGGNGGAGGLGGTVFTGNADSKSATVNLLNTILVRVRI